MHLNVLYTNADQFLNKCDHLLISITIDRPDIILITEVFPKALTIPITLASLNYTKLFLYNCYFNFDPEFNNQITWY